MKTTPKAHAIFIILGLAGMGIVLVSTSVYGAGLSPDSVAYIFAAKSLLSGDGYMMLGGDAFVHWPPLFPSLLAGMDLVGIEPLDGVRYFNALVFGLIIIATGHLLRIHLRTWTTVVLGTTLLLVSVIFLRVSIMAWSEPLFVLLVILFFIYLSKFLTEQRLIFLLLIAVLTSLACLQRYLGFSLVLTGFISIAFFMRSKPYQDTLKYLGFFGLVSSIPLFVWLGRNYFLTSSFAGVRPPSSTNFIENLGDTLYSVSFWLLPSDYTTMASIKILFVILSVSVIGGMVVVALRSNLLRGSSVQVVQLAPIALFVPIYIVALLIIRTRFAFYAPIGDRLLSPIYVFVLLFVLLGIERVVRALIPAEQQKWNLQRLWLGLGFLFILSGFLLNEWTVSRLFFIGEVKNQWILDNLLSADGSIQTPFRAIMLIFGISSVAMGLLIITLRRKPWIGRLVIVGLFGVWLIYPVAQSYVYISTKTESGAGGFNSAEWRSSALIDRLKSNPLDGTIYSNVPDAIFILSQTATRTSAIRFPYETLSKSVSATSEFKAALASDTDDTFLVWVDNEHLLDPQRDPNENIGNISLMFDLEELEDFPDGGIYLLK